jgi:serine/threonine protein kinase
MIIYEMMTGLPPWYTTDRSQLFRRLKSAPLDIPSYFSESSADCVAGLLERNPRRRLGVTGISVAMNHPFFRNINWRTLYSRRVEAPVQPCEGWKTPDMLAATCANIDSTSNHGGSGTMPSHNDEQNHTTNQFHSDGIIKFDSNMLDSATQNFDAQFTRMAVESEDHTGAGTTTGQGEDEFFDDLNEETFLGFTFDIVKERDKAVFALDPATDSNNVADAAARHRTQNYHSAIDGKEQT